MVSRRIRKAGALAQVVIFGALVLCPWIGAFAARPLATSAMEAVDANGNGVLDYVEELFHMDPRAAATHDWSAATHLLIWVSVGALGGLVIALLARQPEGEPIRESSN